MFAAKLRTARMPKTLPNPSLRASSRRTTSKKLSSEKGKFRAFLLAALKHFLANEWDRAKCQKRGGVACAPLSFDWQDADTRCQISPPDNLSPDKLYDRAWAVTLLERVILRLRQECEREGKLKSFEQLKPFLMAGQRRHSLRRRRPQRFKLNEVAVRVAVHRLRHRYRRCSMREEIVQTLSDPAQAEEEMRSLFNSFSDS